MRDSTRTRRTRRGFTLVEIMVGLSLVVLIGAYLADSFIFASRAEQAVNKKMITARALQYMHFRIRRDAKWARFVEIQDPIPGSNGSGHTIVFKDLTGKTRTYKWNKNPDSLKLTIPKVEQPNGTAVEYDQCKFRWVDFNTDEGGKEGVRVLLAPLPMDEKLEQSGEKEVLWGVAMVGRTELDARSAGHRYEFFNEPFFPHPPR
jgi:prepilin-type N-terminal cleavage/methylation domain-containing protein